MTKKLPCAISKEDFVKLIKNTNKDVHKTAFLLGFGAGMRVSEIIKLEQRDVNLKEKKIFIRQGKGSKDRIVPTPKGFTIRQFNQLPLKIGVRALEIAFRSACKRAGLLEKQPDLHFHSLRHGFASHLVNQGMDIQRVRTLMGHSNISTTSVYLQLNPKEALESYEELF